MTPHKEATVAETTSQVLSYLDGVVFPADKSELVAHASLRGAPANLLATLDSLPDRSYDSPSAVSVGIEAMTPQAGE